jgi:plastocyanin
MEQKHLDEMDDSYFGEETIDDDYPVLKVEEKKKEHKPEVKKEEKKPVVKTVKAVAPKKKEEVHEEEVQIKPARVEVHHEPVKEVKPEPAPVAPPVVEIKKEEPQEASNQGSIWWRWLILALIILIVVGFYTKGFGLYSSNTGEVPTPEVPVINETVNTSVETPEPFVPVTTDKGTELTILAKRWMFDPNTLYVKTGEKIHLTVKATDLDFVFSIPELGVQQSVSGITLIDFSPDASGTYKFSCSSCDSWRGMEGQLIVK